MNLAAVRRVVESHEKNCSYYQQCCAIDDAARQLLDEVDRLRREAAIGAEVGLTAPEGAE